MNLNQIPKKVIRLIRSMMGENPSNHASIKRTEMGTTLSAPTLYGRKPRLVMGIKTYNRQDYLEQCMNTFLNTCSNEYEWVVIIADDGSTDKTRAYLESLDIPHELYIINNQRKYSVGQINAIFALCETIHFDVGFCVDDDLVFKNAGWDHLYVQAVLNSGYSHLVYRYERHTPLPNPTQDVSGWCQAFGPVDVDGGPSSLFTFTDRTLLRAGYGDKQHFPIRGSWLTDYHLRCCRAGENDVAHVFDAVGSNDYLEIQHEVSDNDRYSIPSDEECRTIQEPDGLARQHAVMADASRVYIAALPSTQQARGTSLNECFDKIYVLNLDRRSDRWERLSAEARSLGLKLDRFSAVDGSESPYKEQYESYCRQPLAQVPEKYELKNTFEFYRNYPSEESRVAYLEQRDQHKAIASCGAWGYMLTMINVLEDALAHGYETILVLDDDVIFHRQFSELFAHAMLQVPEKWKILQLGTLQYDWGEEWIQPYSENMYRDQGTGLGSHAVGMHQSVLPLVLKACKQKRLPYDEGPLHFPKAMAPEQCFTFFPNLLIQDVSESDISDTTHQRAALETKHNVFRWNLEEYRISPHTQGEES